VLNELNNCHSFLFLVFCAFMYEFVINNNYPDILTVIINLVVFQFIFCDKLALLALFVILVCRRLYIFKPRNSIHFQLPAERSLAGNLLSASDEDPLYCLSCRLWARMQCTGRSAAMPPVIRIYVTER